MKVSSPFFTGQGGADFEFSVCALYFSYMLTDDSPNCLPGKILEINLQTSYSGDSIEDIVIDTSEYGTQKRNYFQIKHSLEFTESNIQFKKVIKQAWLQFNNPNFNRDRDRLLIGLGLISVQLQSDFDPLCEWARSSSNSDSFLNKVFSRGYSSENRRVYFQLLKKMLTTTKGSIIDDKEIWNFFKCFYVCHFEVSEGKKDWNYCVNRLSDKVNAGGSNIDKKIVAELLMSHLYRLAGYYSNKGGSIRKQMLIDNSKGLLTPSPIKSAALKYSEDMKIINEEVFKKLQNLEIVKDSLSSLALKVDDQYYQRIPYIAHAEKKLKSYTTINDNLTNVKELVVKYNNIGSQMDNELVSYIRQQIFNNLPGLNESMDFNLNEKNSFSMPQLLELLYDYLEKRDDSEIISLKGVNIYSLSNEQFGFTLERTLRGAGVQVAWRIITSSKEKDTVPEILSNIFNPINSNETVIAMLEELNSIHSQVFKNLEAFKNELKTLSECIDLGVSFD